MPQIEASDLLGLGLGEQLVSRHTSQVSLADLQCATGIGQRTQLRSKAAPPSKVPPKAAPGGKLASTTVRGPARLANQKDTTPPPKGPPPAPRSQTVFGPPLSSPPINTTATKPPPQPAPPVAQPLAPTSATLPTTVERPVLGPPAPAPKDRDTEASLHRMGRAEERYGRTTDMAKKASASRKMAQGELAAQRQIEALAQAQAQAQARARADAQAREANRDEWDRAWDDFSSPEAYAARQASSQEDIEAAIDQRMRTRREAAKAHRESKKADVENPATPGWFEGIISRLTGETARITATDTSGKKKDEQRAAVTRAETAVRVVQQDAAALVRAAAKAQAADARFRANVAEAMKMTEPRPGAGIHEPVSVEARRRLLLDESRARMTKIDRENTSEFMTTLAARAGDIVYNLPGGESAQRADDPELDRRLNRLENATTRPQAPAAPAPAPAPAAAPAPAPASSRELANPNAAPAATPAATPAPAAATAAPVQTSQRSSVLFSNVQKLESMAPGPAATELRRQLQADLTAAPTWTSGGTYDPPTRAELRARVNATMSAAPDEQEATENLYFERKARNSMDAPLIANTPAAEPEAAPATPVPAARPAVPTSDDAEAAQAYEQAQKARAERLASKATLDGLGQLGLASTPSGFPWGKFIACVASGFAVGSLICHVVDQQAVRLNPRRKR